MQHPLVSIEIHVSIRFLLFSSLPQIEVAVKTLRVDAMGHGEQEFMREARIMITLNHPCIVRLIGVTRGKPMMLVS